MININHIFIKQNSDNKNEVFDFIANQAIKSNIILVQDKKINWCFY